MKFFLFIIFFFIFQNCSKPKTVLICGDHACVNKAEAELYLEENLSIEVKIIDNKKKKTIDLVELNLKDNSNKDRKIEVTKKLKTNKNIRVLSNNEIEVIKKNTKLKIKKKKIVKKNINIKKEKIKNIDKRKKEIQNQNNQLIKKKNVNKPNKKVTDICTIIEKCSIDEISKYLLKKGNKDKFPDITTRN